MEVQSGSIHTFFGQKAHLLHKDSTCNDHFDVQLTSHDEYNTSADVFLFHFRDAIPLTKLEGNQNSMALKFCTVLKMRPFRPF